jgi:tRNA(adenine34) deaminase
VDFSRRIVIATPTGATTGRSKSPQFPVFSPQLKDIGLVTVDWGLWTDFMDEPIIDLHSDDYFMREALRQAERAYAADEVPVGAVIVREGRIIARAFNQVEQLKDATAHAEMLALTQAEEIFGDWRLTDCTLYVTKEPCPMCAGAMVHTRLARVVFGASDLKGGAAGGAMNLLQFPTLNHHCEITGGIREADCRELLQRFFARQRLSEKSEKKNGNDGPDSSDRNFLI